jgi:hypothetical protein
MKNKITMWVVLLSLGWIVTTVAEVPVSGWYRSPKALMSKRESNDPLDKTPYKLMFYLNANAHPENLQMGRIFADMANMGATTVCMLPQIYMEFAAQGLNSVAAQYGIGIVVNGMMHLNDNMSETDARAAYKKNIDRINSYENGKSVIGYGLSDEVEGGRRNQKAVDIGRILTARTKLLQELDPKRFVFTNHHVNSIPTRGGMIRSGETFTGCSVFWANRYAEKRLLQVKKWFEEAGLGKVPQLAIYGAQGTANAMASPKSMSANGIEGVTIGQIKKISLKDDIIDYIVVPFGLGYAGTGIFAYDAYYDYHWYSIVDERGRSNSKKREAIRQGMELVRAAEGCPTLKLTVGVKGKTLNIRTNASSVKAKISKIIAEVSFDGGITWKRIKKIKVNTPGTKFKLPEAWMRSRWTMVRAIAIDNNGKKSFFSVWNAFPWGKPKAS